MSGPIVLVLRMLLAIALYGFLGFALLALWRDVQRESQILTRRRVPGISLIIQTGGDAPRLRQFNQSEISVGRDPACDVPLLDETVSARHAQLTYHHAQWWVEDLGSTNNTRLNQTLVTMPTVLTTGDEIECGNSRLTISLSSNALASSTQQLEKQG